MTDTTETKETYWLCRGTKKERHPEEEVEIGERCPICNSAYASPRETAGSSLPVGGILGGVALLAVLGVVSWQLLKPLDSIVSCEENPIQEKCDPCKSSTPPKNCPQPPEPPGSDDYLWQPERFTKGQRTLFPGVTRPSLNNGIEAFKKQDYQKAITFFDKAVTTNLNEPEPLILLNNAKARKQGNPLTLAVVVPVDGSINSAKEMLRGVAMAQNEFNNSGGIGNRLLEIVIANDENKPEISKQVAQQLVNDPSILGVIGHNSSSASGAGLKVYDEKPNGLAMISPTSTSTSLQGDVFFRTTPSDAAAAEKLAKYISEELNLSKAVIFYNPNSSYSKSLKENFESKFKGFKGKVVRSIDLSQPSFSAEDQVPISVYHQAEVALLFPNKDYIEEARAIAIANADIAINRRLKLLGGDALYTSDTLIQGGENVEGLVIAVPWSRQTPTSRAFTKAGSEQWRGSVNWRTAMSYDATQAFIHSFSNNNNSRSSVLDGLRQVKLRPTETSGNEVQFTDKGERQGDPVLVEVARGVQERPRNTEFGFKLIK
ncbi:MAG: ABC transporter substrate-binding protein [Xenococcaceae cyanobacterium MO_167.B52]|nr:ABC transporter substrate-binding protein [Xenococcaceae cyanobacterium MO_167.B52]